MTTTLREYYDSEGRPQDREWLDARIERFITSKEQWSGHLPDGEPCRSERDIYRHFAPTRGALWRKTRPSWHDKPRKTKRQMIVASLRRLTAVGKIRVESIDYSNRGTMNGLDRRNQSSFRELFGGDHDGLIRTYTASNILQVMADALRLTE